MLPQKLSYSGNLVTVMMAHDHRTGSIITLLYYHATDQISMLFFFVIYIKLQMDVTTKSECSCRSRPKSVWLQLLEGGICRHPSELTGNDSMQRGPNYCLIRLIVVSDKRIPTEVPGISLTALLKTYRPLLTSSCCYVQRQCWSSQSHKWDMYWTQSCHYCSLKWGSLGMVHLQERAAIL